MKQLKVNLLKKFLALSTRNRSTNCKILGIESSCDDTCCGIVDSSRNILGEASVSSQTIALQYGGVMPMIAGQYHQKSIEPVVNAALNSAHATIDEMDAIAVTTRPGLASPLLVGMNYAKYLCRKYEKPLIPIHHMEAHALTARLCYAELEYPYLAFLLSGGHCLLTVVENYDKFSLLGKALCDAPGEAFDKAARFLRLRNKPEYRYCSGGEALEREAMKGDPTAFRFTPPLAHYRNCNFSFSGMKSQLTRYIKAEEVKAGVEGDQILPNASDLCASFMYSAITHLCWRLQRAIEFVEDNEMLKGRSKTLVVSGGVARSSLVNTGLSIVCEAKGYKLLAPPARLCSDNGVMIAWNGVEKYTNNFKGYSVDEFHKVDIQPSCPLSTDISSQVEEAHIKCEWISLKPLMKQFEGYSSTNVEHPECEHSEYLEDEVEEEVVDNSLEHRGVPSRLKEAWR